MDLISRDIRKIQLRFTKACSAVSETSLHPSAQKHRNEDLKEEPNSCTAHLSKEWLLPPEQMTDTETWHPQCFPTERFPFNRVLSAKEEPPASGATSHQSYGPAYLRSRWGGPSPASPGALRSSESIRSCSLQGIFPGEEMTQGSSQDLGGFI